MEKNLSKFAKHYTKYCSQLKFSLLNALISSIIILRMQRTQQKESVGCRRQSRIFKGIFSPGIFLSQWGESPTFNTSKRGFHTKTPHNGKNIQNESINEVPMECRPIFLFKKTTPKTSWCFFSEDFRWTFWCQKTAVAISNIAHPKLHKSALSGWQFPEVQRKLAFFWG